MKITDWTIGTAPKEGVIYRNMPIETYHRGHGISKSRLDAFLDSPAMFDLTANNPRPQTPAQRFGDAFHCAVLEPERFERDYTPDACEGKITIPNKGSPDKGIWGLGEYDKILAMRKVLLASKTVSALLDENKGEAELSGYWRDPGTDLLCRARPDFYNRELNVFVDLKTTRNAASEPFSNACAKYRYHMQAAFYEDGFAFLDIPVEAFVFVAIEKTPPFRHEVYVLSPSDVVLGAYLYRDALIGISRCIDKNHWPHSTDIETPDTITELSLPQWAYNK